MPEQRSSAAVLGSMGKEQAIHEQWLRVEWLNTNGHDHASAFLHRMGATDWLTEEILILLDQAV